MRRRRAVNASLASICARASHEADQGIAAHARDLQRAPVLEEAALRACQRLAQGLFDAGEAVRPHPHVAPLFADGREQHGERHHLAVHLGAALHREPVPLVGHLHAHVAAADASHVQQPGLVDPLDVHLVAGLAQRGHHLQRRVAFGHPPAPGLDLLARHQTQPFGQRVRRLPLLLVIAARPVAIAPLSLEHQPGSLARGKHRPMLHRPHRQPHLQRPRGQQLQPRHQPGQRRGDGARPARGELDVHRFLQALQPRGERVVGLGRERRRRHRQRRDQRRRLGRQLGQQQLRAAAFVTVQVQQVTPVAQGPGHLRCQQVDPQEVEGGGQGAVGGADEVQAQPPLADVQAFAALARAAQEHGRVIDQRPHDVEQLPGRQPPGPRRAVAQPAVGIGLVHALVGRGQPGARRQAVPGEAGSLREGAAPAALLDDWLDVERAVGQGLDPEAHPFLRRPGAARGLGLQAQQALVQPPERKLPGGQPQQVPEIVVRRRRPGIAEEIDHRLQRPKSPVFRDLVRDEAVLLVTRPAQRRLLPAEQQQRGVCDQLWCGARPRQGRLVTAEHGHRRLRHHHALGRVGAHRQNLGGGGGQLAQFGAESIEEGGQDFVPRIRAVGIQPVPLLAVPGGEQGQAVQVQAGRFAGIGEHQAPFGLEAQPFDQQLAVRCDLAETAGQVPARGTLGVVQEIVEAVRDAVVGGPGEEILRILRGRRDRRCGQSLRAHPEPGW